MTVSGSITYGAGVTRDVARAADLFKKACDEKDIAGCEFLKRLYSSQTEACQGGDAAECFILGDLYAQGRSVSRDAARAAALFKQACDGGFAKACERLKQPEK